MVSESPRSLIEDFVWRQSYGKTFGDPGELGSVAPPRVGGSSGRWPLPGGLTAALASVSWPVDWTAGSSPDVPCRRVQALLYNALGIVRREPSNPYNDHRAFPSPRCLFPTHAYLLCARTGRAFLYNPMAHALETPDGFSAQGADSPEQSWSARAGGVVAVVSRYTRIPAYYRDLRYTLAVLEAGHALYNLALVAAALQVPARVCLAFDDAAVLRRLMLKADEGWMPVALVTLGHTTLDAGASVLDGSEDTRGGSCAAPRSEDPPADRLSAVDAAAWLAAEDCDPWRRRRAAPPPRAPDGAIRIPEPKTTAVKPGGSVLQPQRRPR